jgi:hypothetical protein
MRFSTPKPNSDFAKEEQEATFGAAAAHAQRVVRDPLRGGEFREWCPVDPRAEDQLSFFWGERFGGDCALERRLQVVVPTRVRGALERLFGQVATAVLLTGEPLQGSTARVEE